MLVCAPQVVSVTTSEAEVQVKRAPFELCVLLDRSGSMGGDRLNFSKEAIKLLIDNLDETDRLHFLCYDDSVSTIFVSGDLKDKNHLKKLVDNGERHALRV